MGLSSKAKRPFSRPEHNLFARNKQVFFFSRLAYFDIPPSNRFLVLQSAT